MKKLIGCIAVAAFIIAGAQLLRAHKSQALVSPADQLTLRDAPNDAPPNGEPLAMPELPKLKLSGGSGGSQVYEGVDEDGSAYKHVVNTKGFFGVYMTRNKHVTGFLDILGGKDGFCQGEMVTMRTRAMDNDGKPIIMGTCLAPPVDGVLHYDYAGCAFKLSLMRDAKSGDAMTYLNVVGGNCTDVGTGHADLSAMNGVGFWLLK
ncbi:MAG: hypothetical protein NTY77_19150 [Elusimicrobia bacterium]|nr:hypothetical protein [Elusimicrobiota bacterium]